MPSADAPRRVWCLNLDAEEELRRGTGYTPSRATLAAVEASRPLATGLLGPRDLRLEDLGEPVAARERGAYRGEAWCPTPRALRALAAVGVEVPVAPSLDVLRQVNASRFPYDVLGPRLEGARVACVRDEAEAWAEARPAGSGAMLKRAFGATGRGKLRVHAGPLTPPACAFLTDTELALGVVLEPLVRVTLEVSQHGRLARDGALTLGAPCVQQVRDGRFVSVRRALPGELHASEQQALTASVLALVAAMRAAGYFGPFGVDAYRYEDEHGAQRWNPCGELNARYTMGYATGMQAASRPDVPTSSC